ncbi:GntR family transcriptional regulator [Streptomyces sp. NBC_00199]|uniref:GntR family transcriptional regulator n=1 Tax=Streptomyces sp. NBC_00199 TaxID=2975678 RepID=UPI00225AF9E8|nr:GntR family transcriptional regulator [Streptomyces sp. NBC_00199]MCX5266100.1 GntR family transcriptional regulator [Streptomyces sp. NBC_00199]
MADPAPYLVIAEELRGRIVGGEFTAGDKLPSVAELGRAHGVAPSVGSRAYGVLVEDGLVISRHGAGHYVRGDQSPELLVRRHRKLSQDSPFAQGVAEQGAEGTWRHDSATASADERTAARLGVREGDPVMRTDYVYLADGQPVQLATSWEPIAVTGQSMIVLPEAGPYAGVGVAARMRVIGVEVGEPVEQVKARGATRAEAQALGINPSAPVLAVERTYFDQSSGRPVETADVVMRGDRWVAVYGAPPSVSG